MKIIITLLIAFFALSSFSQSRAKYILKTNRHFSIHELSVKLQLSNGEKIKEVFPELNIYSIETLHENVLIEQRFIENPVIDFFEKDSKLEYRDITPNDKFYTKQYGPQQILANEIWEHNIGGLSGIGDSIVIAVLDKGLEIKHEDLHENIWRNKGEVPNDNIDNDNNGYTDDYFGVDLLKNNDDHQNHHHGTSVAGIIGATGNNHKGIAGINWNIKILPITSVTSVSDVIEAYRYVYKERKKYNDSNGKIGSLIVCTNLSAGISRALPKDKSEFGVWCDMYNLLGETGILNITSVTNDAVDVEEVGDMPTRCTSDYLITVTSTKEDDNFDIARGFGINSVDVAAPGKGIYTTSINNGYTTKFSGNSAAAPHVAGMIGLLYTIPCKGFTDKIIANPKELSYQIKDYLLKYTDKHADLQEKTFSGGRINAYNTYLKLADLCGDLKVGEFKILKVSPNPVSSILSIEYSTDNFDTHTFILSNKLGQVIYSKDFKPSIFDKKILSLDMRNYEQGTYFITIFSNKRKASRSIFKY